MSIAAQAVAEQVIEESQPFVAGKSSCAPILLRSHPGRRG
jgi:hypothetical protein